MTEPELRSPRHRLDEPADPEPWLSVIIPVRNEAGSIAEALTAVIRPGVEVIVVDGGSNDGTAERARMADVRIVESPPGRGPQLNAGAAVARGSTLFFLHVDTRPPADFDAIIRRVLASPWVALGAFRLRIDLPGWPIRLIEWGVWLRGLLFRMPYADQGFFLRAETFRRLGGFPAIPLMEDVALVQRARRLGAVRIAPERVLTSGRRWRSAGPWRMTLINLGCRIGWSLGIAPERLASWRDRLSHPKAPASNLSHSPITPITPDAPATDSRSQHAAQSLSRDP
ncbi:MAG: glycosyl transferase [Isosphaeraceae bacterium]|jgi:rSAM/selenodomain-associated transferase 2|nr:MAG: glycosyl transferase [Isosphaeraceae bacterium]